MSFAHDFALLLDHVTADVVSMHRPGQAKSQRRGQPRPRPTLTQRAQSLTRRAPLLGRAKRTLQDTRRQLQVAFHDLERLRQSPDLVTPNVNALDVISKALHLIERRIINLTSVFNALHRAHTALGENLARALPEARIVAIVQGRIRRAIKPIANADAAQPADHAVRLLRRAFASVIAARIRINPSLTQALFNELLPRPALSTRGAPSAFDPTLVLEAYDEFRRAHPNWKHDAVTTLLASRLHVSKRTIDNLLRRARRKK